MENFKPNRLTFEDGIKRIANANKSYKFNPDKAIVTSRDDVASKLMKKLKIDNIPNGFDKWQLPFSLDRAQLFISVGLPNTKVPKHSHDEGAGIRFIVAGSIEFGGKELTAGDLMYIPKGSDYAFQVGKFGATMAYCYSCCCA